MRDVAIVARRLSASDQGETSDGSLYETFSWTFSAPGPLAFAIMPAGAPLNSTVIVGPAPAPACAEGPAGAVVTPPVTGATSDGA